MQPLFHRYPSLHISKSPVLRLDGVGVAINYKLSFLDVQPNIALRGRLPSAAPKGNDAAVPEGPKR